MTIISREDTLSGVLWIRERGNEGTRERGSEREKWRKGEEEKEKNRVND